MGCSEVSACCIYTLNGVVLRMLVHTCNLQVS